MDAFTFRPVSVVIARPLGTRPAVLCFFTSLTETTGMATWGKTGSQCQPHLTSGLDK